MAYCTIQDLRDVLPATITIGDSLIPSATSAYASTITTSVANKYIYFATQFVDSRLSQLYFTPLTRIKQDTRKLIANMLPGSRDVMVEDIAPYYVGGSVRITDDNGSEEALIDNIPETVVEGGNTVRNFRHITLAAPTINAYDAGSHGVVDLLLYSPPIPVATARLACALMFDKLFVAEQHPDVSSYGKTLRNLATRDMNAILTGQVSLVGQEFCSRRFVRHNLFDAVRLSVESVTYDQGSENA